MLLLVDHGLFVVGFLAPKHENDTLCLTVDLADYLI